VRDAPVPNAENVVLAICRLPVDSRLIMSVSAVDLVRRSGYMAVRSEITVERLATCLRAHPDWVDGWFGWSEDSRAFPDWYAKESEPGRYQVGYIDRPPRQPPMTFTDRVQACAEYVYREIESMADLIDRPSGGRGVADPESVFAATIRFTLIRAEEDRARLLLNAGPERFVGAIPFYLLIIGLVLLAVAPWSVAAFLVLSMWAVTLAVAAFFYLGPTLWHSFAARRHPGEPSDQTTLTVDQFGFQVTRGAATVTHEWHRTADWIENGEFMALRLRRTPVSIVPKRVFASEADLNRFVAVLRLFTNVPRAASPQPAGADEEASGFVDVWNPTDDEVRAWAQTDGYQPTEDWELAVYVLRPEFLAELAADASSPKRLFFLQCLYHAVGDTVRPGRGHPLLAEGSEIVRRVPATGDALIEAWRVDATRLLAGKIKFDPDEWCGGRLANRRFSELVEPIA
jgi:hypothetical protein